LLFLQQRRSIITTVMGMKSESGIETKIGTEIETVTRVKTKIKTKTMSR